MTDRYDELLKQGLIKLKEMEFSYVPEKEDIDHNFSDKYLSNKERLLNKLSRSYWKYVNTVAKKVAVIIISFIIAFSSLLTVDAFRESIINFVVTIFDSFSKVEQSSTNEEIIYSYYTIGKLPSGYMERTSHKSKAVYFQVWSTSNNKQISLNQVPANTSNQFDSEHGIFGETIINDTPCFICQDENYFFCYWKFDGYRFELIYPIDLGEDFMSEVVGRLVEVDPEELTTE